MKKGDVVLVQIVDNDGDDVIQMTTIRSDDGTGNYVAGEYQRPTVQRATGRCQDNTGDYAVEVSRR